MLLHMSNPKHGESGGGSTCLGIACLDASGLFLIQANARAKAGTRSGGGIRWSHLKGCHTALRARYRTESLPWRKYATVHVLERDLSNRDSTNIDGCRVEARRAEEGTNTCDTLIKRLAYNSKCLDGGYRRAAPMLIQCSRCMVKGLGPK